MPRTKRKKRPGVSPKKPPGVSKTKRPRVPGVSKPGVSKPSVTKKSRARPRAQVNKYVGRKLHIPQTYWPNEEAPREGYWVGTIKKYVARGGGSNATWEFVVDQDVGTDKFHMWTFKFHHIIEMVVLQDGEERSTLTPTHKHKRITRPHVLVPSTPSTTIALSINSSSPSTLTPSHNATPQVAGRGRGAGRGAATRAGAGAVGATVGGGARRGAGRGAVVVVAGVVGGGAGRGRGEGGGATIMW